MRIATYNVNGVNARLPVLLRWLADARPEVACLQELKAPQEKYPQDALRETGYSAVSRLSQCPGCRAEHDGRGRHCRVADAGISDGCRISR
jgi:exonuclease III